MQSQDQKHLQELQKGQLWKLEQGYVSIAEVGKRLIYYKLLSKPEQQAAITRMLDHAALISSLRQGKAELVSAASPPELAPTRCSSPSQPAFEPRAAQYEPAAGVCLAPT